MKNFFTLFFVACLMLGLTGQTLAQISGKVTDNSDGSGLPGVNIVIKGTSIGTTSSGDGSYSINAQAGQVLQFTYVGYIAQEITVGSSAVIDVSLESDTRLLEDVVVVGYGEQEKKDVTGAMSTIKAEDFNAGAINSPEQLFQGKLSGVLVVANSGEPGGGITINVRGANSIRAGNNPLFVVDGFPLDGRDISSAGIDLGGLGSSSARNPLNFINPDDIESIDVLKDASATAIYGSRGANGVVIVTTKKAKPGESSFSLNSYVGISNVTNELDLLDRDAFVSAVTATGSTPQDFGGNTDWQDEIYRTGITHSHSLSFAKGAEKGSYRISLSYFNQEGIVEKAKLERITARINANQEIIDDRLTADFQLTLGRTNDVFVPITNNAGFQGSLVGAALQANPTIPVRHPTDDPNGAFLAGDLVQGGEQVNGIVPAVPDSYLNPIALLEFIDDEAETTRILGNGGLTLKIIEGLDFRSTFGIDYSFSERRVDQSPRLFLSANNFEGSAGVSNVQLSSYLIENFLTYKKDFGGSSINALLGYSYQEFSQRFNTNILVNTQVPGTDISLGTNNLGFGEIDPANRPASGNQTNKLQSFYSRVNYSLKDKYLITATVRIDGSSRFGSNNRYAVFPSVAVAWRLSEEDFIPEIFTDLKLRAGWGETGNQEIPNGATQALFNVDPVSGDATQTSVPNPDIKWEETTQWNIGVDFAFFDGRLSGTLDYYDKRTTNLLLSLPVPAPTFVERAFTNVDADLINTGVELALTGIIMDGQNGGFRWDLSANATYFTKNTIEGLAPTIFDTGEINGQGLTGQFAQRIAEGQNLFAFYIPVFEGFDDNGDAILANGGERQFIGQAQPDFIYGITSTMSYKGFDLTLNFNGQAGNDVYNNTANALFSRPALSGNRNVTTDVANSPENPAGTPTVSTQYLEDAGFFRFNNFTLGYSFNTGNIDWLSKLRLYFSGQNLFVITDYSGYDPEVNVNKSLNGVPSLGIDYTGFPRNRTFIFGAQIGF